MFKYVAPERQFAREKSRSAGETGEFRTSTSAGEPKEFIEIHERQKQRSSRKSPSAGEREGIQRNPRTQQKQRSSQKSLSAGEREGIQRNRRAADKQRSSKKSTSAKEPQEVNEVHERRETQTGSRKLDPRWSSGVQMMSMTTGASGGMYRHQPEQEATEEFSDANESRRKRRTAATATRTADSRGIPEEVEKSF